MITMHHHIELEDEVVNQYFHYQSASSFRNQLINLKKSHAQNNRDLILKVTLDDGLKSQLTAAKILDDLNIKGYFYYNSSTFTNKKILNVHLVHILLKTLSPHSKKSLYRDLECSIEHSVDFKNAEYIYRKQGSFDIDQKIKYLVNYVMTSEEVDDILKHYYFSTNNISLGELNTLIYMSCNDLKQLYKSGHYVLPHGHSHKILGKMSHGELDLEFSKMFDAHFSLFKTHVDEFCVPYGSTFSWSSACDQLAKSYGIKHVILVDDVRSIICEPDPDLLYYSRIDCCQLSEYEYL